MQGICINNQDCFDSRGAGCSVVSFWCAVNAEVFLEPLNLEWDIDEENQREVGVYEEIEVSDAITRDYNGQMPERIKSIVPEGGGRIDITDLCRAVFFDGDGRYTRVRIMFLLDDGQLEHLMGWSQDRTQSAEVLL